MEVIVHIDIKGVNNLSADFRHGLEKGMRQAIIFAEGKAKTDFSKSRSSAGGLHVRSGHLRRSIQSGISKSGDDITAWLGSSVIYSSTHELGATITPKKGKYLKFPINGAWKSVKQVVIPERKFLEPGITENISRIGSIILSNIEKETNK